jgi:hypothetical protein
VQRYRAAGIWQVGPPAIRAVFLLGRREDACSCHPQFPFFQGQFDVATASSRRVLLCPKSKTSEEAALSLLEVRFAFGPQIISTLFSKGG